MAAFLSGVSISLLKIAVHVVAIFSAVALMVSLALTKASSALRKMGNGGGEGGTGPEPCIIARLGFEAGREERVLVADPNL